MRDEPKKSNPFDGLSQWALDPGASRSHTSGEDEVVALPDALAGLPFFQQNSMVGERVESWQIEALLGQGGMASVYLARHIWLEQRAALKLLLPIFAKDPHVLQRFQREAVAISRLSHPNIVEIKDFGFAPDHGLFMVMEYLQGQDLESIMLQAPFSKDWILSLFGQVCEGLGAVHEADVLHRDIKPSNLFLLPGEPFPTVKLLDFGVAKVQFQGEGQDKITRTGVIVGTPKYLSPEQIHHLSALSPATDLYALGVVLFECLTGHHPVKADTSTNFLIQVARDQPALLSAYRPTLKDTSIERFVSRVLSKRPENRPASTKVFWQELQEAMASYQDPEGRARTPTVAFVEASQQEVAHTPREVVAYETDGHSLRASSHEGALATADGLVAAGFPGRKPAARKARLNSLGIALIAGLLCALAALGWYALQLHQKVHVATHTQATPQPRPAQGLLDDLVIQGRNALKKRAYQQAVTLWKRATKQPHWRRSRHYPKLYRAIGVALAKQEQLYSAVFYFQKYKQAIQSEKKRILRLQRQLAEANADLLRRKVIAARLERLLQRVPKPEEVKRELANLLELESELQKRAQKTSLMLAVFRAGWEARRWQQSLARLQEIQHRAPSIPAIHIQVARVLAQTFIPLGLQHLHHVLQKMEPTASQHKQIKRLQQEWQRDQAKAEHTWKQSLQEMAEQLKAGKRQLALRQARKLLADKALANGGLHQLWRVWLRHQSQRSAAHSQGFWPLYAAAMKRLQRAGLWSWLRLQDPMAMSPRRARLAAGLLRGIGQAKEHHKHAQKAIQDGDIAAAVKAARAFLRTTNLLKQIDPWQVAATIHVHVPAMTSVAKQFGRAAALLQKASTAYRQARFATIPQHHQTVLAALPSGQAQTRVRQLFARQSKQISLAQRALSSGHRAFARFQWAQARKEYQTYLQWFPQTHILPMLKQRLKVCRCLLKIFPWEVCNDLQLPRGYTAPGARR